MALDGQKKGLSAANSNEHVSNILTSAKVHTVSDDCGSVKVDINIDDYFKLAELKVKPYHCYHSLCPSLCPSLAPQSPLPLSY